MFNPLGLVLGGMSEACFVVDGDWNFVFANERFCKHVERALETLTGKSLWLEFPALVGSVYEQMYRKAVETGQPASFESGEASDNIWQKIRAVPGENHLAVFLEERRIPENQFQVMANSAPVMLWVSDLTKACIWFNKPWLDFTGRPLEDEVGNGWAERVHPDDFDRCLEIYVSNFDARRPFTMEYRLLRHDNEYRWLLDNGVPIHDANEEFTGFVGSCIDITMQKTVEEERSQLLERERRARSEAERISRLKDEFLTTLSHELRTPLNAILGWSNLVLNHDLGAEDQKHGLETIERSARNQLQLVEDLLDMSRIVSGKVRLELRKVDLTDIIEATLDAVRPTAHIRDITLSANLDSQAGQVLGDADRLHQVLWHLLSNAIKFTPPGGRVEVQLKRVGAQVEIEVSDTGQGISAEFLPHVFERFRQEDASTTRTAGGLGVGLAIVKHFVELHGGVVSGTSPAPGAGSTFTISMPAARTGSTKAKSNSSTPASPPAQNNEKQSLAGLHILVVDDERDARELLSRILKLAGGNVTEASSGADALLIACNQSIDLLVADIGMPGMDGYELIKQLRSSADNRLRDLPMMALTAYAGSVERDRVLESGFDFYMSKPVIPAEMVAAAAQLTGRIS
jgi:PAS domain S-box-containing protein